MKRFVVESSSATIWRVSSREFAFYFQIYCRYIDPSAQDDSVARHDDSNRTLMSSQDPCKRAIERILNLNLRRGVLQRCFKSR